MVKVTACNSSALVPAKAFTHALAVEGAQRWVFISGQVALDAAGQVIAPGDLFSQLEATLQNLGHALDAAGATFSDLVKVTIFVVDLNPADLAQIREIRSRYLPQDPPIAITLVGVAQLAFPGLRIEIEGTAAL